MSESLGAKRTFPPAPWSSPAGARAAAPPRQLFGRPSSVAVSHKGLVCWRRQARARGQALKDASRETAEKPEDAPGTPVQAGEASERVSPHGGRRGVAPLRRAMVHAGFLCLVGRPGDARPSLASARRWLKAGAPAALSLAEGCLCCRR